MQVDAANPASLSLQRPPLGWIILAFTVLYLGYGLNFFAIRLGVESLPPFLFAGAHVVGAGLLLAVWQLVRGRSLLLPPGGCWRAAGSSLFLFVGGIGLVTFSEKSGVPSGVAAVIKASAPLWVVLLEWVMARGKLPSWKTWLGLLCGTLGVLIIVGPQFIGHMPQANPMGVGLLVASAFFFAVGTLLVRHFPPGPDLIASVSQQMLFGGAYLLVVGVLRDEPSQLGFSDLKPAAIGAFAFLLFGHSLGAFLALNWLLRYFPAPVVTTKFYVSPVIAVTAGCLLLGEPFGWRLPLAMVLILFGVALILWRPADKNPPFIQDAEELEE